MKNNVIICKACGKEISKSIKICPHCGNDQRGFFIRNKTISVIGIIVILFIAVQILNYRFGSGSGINKETSTTASSKNLKLKNKLKQENKKYSYSKFMEIGMGMTYNQVEKILGKGIEEASSGEGDTKTITYTWKNDDVSNIFVEIRQGKVVNKSQAMLKNMDAKVTLDNYKKINMGMNYKQVKAILGEGQLASQTSLDGDKDENEMYEWINDDGSNMNITFEDGKVSTKTQIELK